MHAASFACDDELEGGEVHAGNPGRERALSTRATALQPLTPPPPQPELALTTQ
jgi:hypothetical protein